MKVLGYFETLTEKIEIRTIQDLKYVKYRLQRIKYDLRDRTNGD